MANERSGKDKSLNQLLRETGITNRTEPDVRISGLAYDSRDVKKGDLFFAIPGAHSDGHQFIRQAAEKGAAAALVEKDCPAPLPLVKTVSTLEAMSKIADQFFDRPSDQIPVIGVTGTNGKTTTTFLIEGILKTMHKVGAVMGTVNYRIGQDIWPAPNTTPMSLDVQKFISTAKQKGAYAVVMEVSSHALELKRVDDVRFTVGVFTNLTQDHLDFHKSMDKYFSAKTKLFLRTEEPKAVINVDDTYGEKLVSMIPRALAVGFSSAADLRVESESTNLSGVQFTLVFPSGKRSTVNSNLLGRHNIYNCLFAAGALLVMGISEEDIVSGLNAPHAIPGRLERVEAGQNFVVAVDYAHTDDALAQVLKTLRETGPNRLYCVFGAGGDRDKGKRPKMGAVAVTLADHAFVTSDNPRTENPSQILKDIEVGIKNTGRTNYTIIENREEAISKAIQECGRGDILLIAGKGHETYQIIGDIKYPFSDFDVARKVLSKWN